MNHNNLVNLFRALGNPKDALLELKAAREVQVELVKQFPAVPAYQIGLGGGYCNYGNVIRDEGTPAESLEWFERAIQVLSPVNDKEPHNMTARQYLASSHYGRALAFDRLQKPGEAVKDWDRAIELSAPAQQPELRASRTISQIQAGLIVEAIAVIAEPSKQTKLDANEMYNFACIYSIACSKTADKQQEYADRAIELLQKAVDAGWKDASHIAKDTDLDPLRKRDDFKKLLSGLSGKQPAEEKKE